MNLTKWTKSNYICIAAPLHICVLLFLIGNILNLDLPFDLPAASASSHDGILNQPAPPLNLNNWIDGLGKKAAAIRISKYRGKVIYLYFFQHW